VFGGSGGEWWKGELYEVCVIGLEEADVELDVAGVPAGPFSLEGCEFAPHFFVRGRQGVPLSGEGVEEAAGLLLLGGSG